MLAVPDTPNAEPWDAPTFSAGFSVCLHAAVLLVSALAMPALREDEAVLRGEFMAQLRQIEAAAGEAEPDLQIHPPVHIAERDPDDEEPANSRCGNKHGGTMGEPAAPPAGARYAVQGPRDNPDPHIGRQWGASEGFFDGIGLDTRPWSGAEADTPLAPWGRDDSLGNDPVSARGATWGDDLGKSFGSPGIGSGLATLCETCGHTGRGAALHLRTVPGPATPTEPAFWSARLPLPASR